MPQYRRAFIEGGTYFFTVVTCNRKPILTSEPAQRLLHAAWAEVAARYPFQTDAVCLLPEHLHCIWTLPAGDANYSLRWREIKRLFTQGYLEQVGPGERRSASRVRHGEASIWQRRFWEHTICDEQDYQSHVDYIHFNPVRHGLVRRAGDWPWSSFHRYVKEGMYPPDWGDELSKDLERVEVGE